MLTPMFEVDQNDDTIIITIKAPLANVSETEIDIEGHDFYFYSRPYFLRLNLPRKVQENNHSSAKYITEEGKFIIEVSKATKGEFFPDLKLLTALLATKEKTAKKPSIEVIDDCIDVADDDCNNWFLEQKIPEEVICTGSKYGFANQRSGVLANFQEVLHNVIDVINPDQKSHEERRTERIQRELFDFSGDHYLADYFNSIDIDSCVSYKAPWEKVNEISEEELKKFTPEEKEHMLQFKNREYLLNLAERKMVCLGLVDIIYAYAYNHRTTEGENTVESAWTIVKLSSTLSWLESFSSIQDVVINSVRRSICYPLFRNWDLSLKVFQDIQHILKLGKQYILKCLLEIYGLFNESEPRYLLNQLYIEDYCIWIQRVSPELIESLVNSLSKVEIEKEHMDLNLELTALIKEHCKGKPDAQLDNLEGTFSKLIIGSDDDSGSESDDDSSTITRSDPTDSEVLDSDDLTESED